MMILQKICIIILISLALVSIYVTIQWLEYTSYFLPVHPYLQYESVKMNSSLTQRAIIIFYPSNQELHYLSELSWLYRSWLEMMKFESNLWRTDLLIFSGEYSSSLQKLGCHLNEIRQNRTEPPQCRVILYLRLLNRPIDILTQRQRVLLDQVDQSFYQIDRERSKLLYKNIQNYAYIDSVNIIAEGYPTFQFYDFLLKTDIDVFVTRQFAKYIPIGNSTLLVGQGGYSTSFNTRRLGRIARDMNWHYQNVSNIGSTWYGSPYVAQHIANLTLDAMLYLNTYEFTRAEKQQKLGTLLWPDWHYGVLSMYGTHLAVNHLLVSHQYQISKADQSLDQSTTNQDPNDIERSNRLHLHCWHTDQSFSKFQFKANKYNSIDPKSLENDRSAHGYAMRMALESRLMTLENLAKDLYKIGVNKTR